jgi:hypothetical protein
VTDQGRERGRGTAAPAIEQEPPNVDPDAIRRSYRVHRARRGARIEHRRRTRSASARFWVVLLLLLIAVVALATTTWHEIGRLYGL